LKIKRSSLFKIEKFKIQWSDGEDTGSLQRCSEHYYTTLLVIINNSTRAQSHYGDYNKYYYYDKYYYYYYYTGQFFRGTGHALGRSGRVASIAPRHCRAKGHIAGSGQGTRRDNLQRSLGHFVHASTNYHQNEKGRPPGPLRTIIIINDKSSCRRR
jgi:hypothetical protein